MMKQRVLVVLWVLALVTAGSANLFVPRAVEAAEGTVQTARAIDAPRRAARLGLTYGLLLDDPFAIESRSGAGLNSAYEFLVSGRFAIGINLAYRYFPASPGLRQLGYGLMLKHYFKTLDDSAGDSVRPYLEYGLLLNVSRLKGVDGAGTAHDTRLTAGVDFEAFGQPLFADFSYHYTRLGFFEAANHRLDYFELTTGLRWTW